MSETAAGRPTVGVLVGSTRPVRIGRQLGDEISALARERLDAEIRMLDLAEINLPWLDEPKMPAKGDYAHEHTLRWKQTIDGLDGLIMVSPQYNGSIPAPLKNAIDTLYGEWENKPILLVTYGFRGGTLAAEHLETVFKIIKAHLLEPRVAITATDEDRIEAGTLADPAGLVGRSRAELDAGLRALEEAIRR